MSKQAAQTRRFRSKALLWLSLGGGLLFVALANAHLLYVASVSQSDCVAHLRLGDAGTQQGRLSAAESSCTPE